MKFSVLLSVYNKENPIYLQQALDSVFNQTIKPSEVVLVKDGPLTKDLEDVLDKYTNNHATFKTISLPTNRGLGFALNEGLKGCSYNLVARMDTDDICYPDRFEKQLKIFDQFPDISFVGAGISEFENSPQIISGYRIPPQHHEQIIKYAKSKSPLNHAAVMYKKDVVLSLGGYREFPEDYHLWVRALLQGYKFYNIQEPLLNVRFNSAAIRRRSGFNYIKTEVKHQREFYSMGFLSKKEFLFNCFARVGLRLMPNRIKSLIYKKILRKS